MKQALELIMEALDEINEGTFELAKISLRGALRILEIEHPGENDRG